MNQNPAATPGLYACGHNNRRHFPRALDSFYLAGVHVVWTRTGAHYRDAHTITVYGSNGRALERATPLTRADAKFAYEIMHAALRAASLERTARWHDAWRKQQAEKGETKTTQMPARK